MHDGGGVFAYIGWCIMAVDADTGITRIEACAHGADLILARLAAQLVVEATPTGALAYVSVDDHVVAITERAWWCGTADLVAGIGFGRGGIETVTRVDRVGRATRIRGSAAISTVEVTGQCIHFWCASHIGHSARVRAGLSVSALAIFTDVVLTTLGDTFIENAACFATGTCVVYLVDRIANTIRGRRRAVVHAVAARWVNAGTW